MRVLYTTHGSDLGGASRSLLDLLAALNDTEVEPVVLLREHGPMEEKLRALGVPFEVITYCRCVHGPTTRVPVSVKELINSLAVRRIVRLIHKRGIDLVHSNSLLSDVGPRAAAIAGVPYISHVREMVTEDQAYIFNNELRAQDLTAHAAMNIFISKFVKDKFAGWLNGAPSCILPNAVAVPGGVACTNNGVFKGGCCRLLLIGRIAPGKGQLEAIKAAKLLNDNGWRVVLKVVGSVSDPSYYEECAAYARDSCGDYVQLSEFTDEVAAEYAAADVVLMCSSAEGMGRVTVEGMLSGALVIGADAGATPELIEDGMTGLLYKSGDPEALAEKIIWAISNAEAAVAIARAGRKYATEKFNKSAYASKMLQIYNGCLGVSEVENG